VWGEAAKWVGKFAEGVVTAVDVRGYPVSVRQTSLPYDAASGVMAVVMPDALQAQPGPASLLVHTHDDLLWNQQAAQLRGRLERGDAGWRFVTTSFEPPSIWKQLRGIGRSATSYLARRGLPRPPVDYAAIERLWERASRLRTGA
jgi:hypothetical protein